MRKNASKKLHLFELSRKNQLEPSCLAETRGMWVLLGFTCRLVAIEHMVSFFKPIWSQLKEALGFNRPEPPDPTTMFGADPSFWT